MLIVKAEIFENRNTGKNRKKRIEFFRLIPTVLQDLHLGKKTQHISCLCTFKLWNWLCFSSWNTVNRARSASFNCRHCSAFLQRREDWPERSYTNLAKVLLLLTTDAEGRRELASGRCLAQLSLERGTEEVWFILRRKLGRESRPGCSSRGCAALELLLIPAAGMKNLYSENVLHVGAITLGYLCRLPITDLTLLLCFSSYRKEIKSRIACLQDSTHWTLGNLDNGHALWYTVRTH